MNYDQLIKNWHTKASEEDYFSKFVFEYLAFVAYLKRKKFPAASTDRSAIQRLKQDNETKGLYLRAIDRSPGLQLAWKRIRQELQEARLGNMSRSGDDVEELKWWNCCHNRLDEKTSEDNNRLMGVIHELSDWENMVEFWYSIRNNLFHGGKNPQDRRDQLLVRDGYKTLRELVAIFLSEG